LQKANPAMTATNTPKLATEADREIGSRIAALRAAQGLSQTALGHAIGVSFQQVQKYEKGRNRVGASRLQRIADQLKVPVETFFSGSRGDDDREAGALARFNDPKVMELVLAYTSIADATTRESVLSIVKAAATIQRGRVAQV
jgi:transcriptional regulator with XRE-family HTH domain